MNTDETIFLNALLCTVRNIRSAAKSPGLAALAIDEELALMKRLKKAMADAQALAVRNGAPAVNELALTH